MGEAASEEGTRDEILGLVQKTPPPRAPWGTRRCFQSLSSGAQGGARGEKPFFLSNRATPRTAGGLQAPEPPQAGSAAETDCPGVHPKAFLARSTPAATGHGPTRSVQLPAGVEGSRR